MLTDLPELFDVKSSGPDGPVFNRESAPAPDEKLTAPDTPGGFLRFWFGSSEDCPGYIVISAKGTAGGLRSHTFPIDDWEKAGLKAEELSKSCDVYFNVCPQEQPKGGSRGTAQTVKGVLGFWSDIDIASDSKAHKAEGNLLGTKQKALDFLAGLPLQPTIIVWSGHGLHVYWKFKEPEVFASEADRQRIARQAQQWECYIQAEARVCGCKIDSVSDLPRILRLPGTLNHKTPPPQPVRLLEFNPERQYGASDFEEYVAVAESRPGEDARREEGTPAKSAEAKCDYALADSGLILDRCAWLKHCKDEAAILPEIQWKQMISILANCKDGTELAHQWSKPYQGYTPRETDEKIRQAQKFAKPYTCNRIYQDSNGQFCGTCEHWKKLHFSPCSLGRPSQPTENSEQWKALGPVKMLADEISRTSFFAQDANEKLYVFTNGVYQRGGDSHVKRCVRGILEDNGRVRLWSSKVAAEVVEFLRIPSPRLLDSPPIDVLNLKNGLLNTKTQELRGHSPEYLSPVQLPVQYDPSAPCPHWEKFISDVFPKDALHVAWQIIALLMLPITSLQKAILLKGEGGNGKSRFLAGISSFLGKQNISTVALQKLESNQFAVSRLMGKLANICADLPSKELGGTSVFKGLTGGDAMEAERKFRDAFSFRPYARLIFSANRLPRSDDDSEAFFRRWLVVPFDRTFAEGDEGYLSSDELDAMLSTEEEKSGLLNKALAVLPEVLSSGISEPQSMRAAFNEFRNITDPMAVWLESNCIKDPSATVAKEELHAAYNADRQRKGHPPVTANAFNRSVEDFAPGVTGPQRMLGGKVRRVWLGIGIRQGEHFVN